MKVIDRYDQSGDFERDPNGTWVFFEDHEQARRDDKRKILEAVYKICIFPENEKLEKAIEKIYSEGGE